MLNEKKSKRGTVIALLCALALLALVILLENTMKPTGMLFTVLKKGAVYALVAVSMNLLNGFTGLFSLGQAGFMLLGAYTYAILTIPTADREAVYYLYNGSAVNFSLPELFGGGAVGLVLGVLLALFLGGCAAAAVAWLIGLPVLRLKSDYLAIATLGFAEIIRAIFQWDPLGPVTNGANALKSFPTFSSFNIQNADGKVILRLSTFVPFLLAGVCVAVIVLLINSTYGRAFKAIRDDEVAAEAMGINLARHKRLAFCISSFFAGVGGGLFAMFANQAQAKVFTTAMTYEILLIVVIGGIIGGVFSATEGSAIAVVYALILAFCYRSINLKSLWKIIVDSAKMSGMVVFLVGVSNILGWVMAFLQIPDAVAAALLSLTSNKYIILLIMNVILLVSGTFMDVTPAILIFTPLFLPICQSFGMSTIQFGLILVYNLCIGNITPPVGNALFVGIKVGRTSLSKVMPYMLMYYVAIIGGLLLVTFIPAVSTALPQAMGLM